ncbi:MAG: CbiQ family ECF transporter T component [Candidatus Nitrotoga sp.]
MIRANLSPHPAVLVLCLFGLVIKTQLFQSFELLMVMCPLVVLALIFFPLRFITLIKRLRWIMLSLLLIYGYATPGNAVWQASEWSLLAQFSPTIEGLITGFLQLGRVVTMLAALAILAGLLSQQQLMSGLYYLIYPLRYMGLPPEKLLMRLALTMQYAEVASRNTARKTTRDWRASLGQITAPVSNQSAQGMDMPAKIDLPYIPLKARDALWLGAGVFLLAML